MLNLWAWYKKSDEEITWSRLYKAILWQLVTHLFAFSNEIVEPTNFVLSGSAEFLENF